MILMGSRAEPAGKARYGVKGEEVGDNDYAVKNPDKIKVTKKA